jgi:hypothetical protein
MRLRLCSYCAAHFKWYTPVCPVCRRAAPPSPVRVDLPRRRTTKPSPRVPNYLLGHSFHRPGPLAPPRVFCGIVLVAVGWQVYHHASEAGGGRLVAEALLWGLFSGVWWGGLLGGLAVVTLELCKAALRPDEPTSSSPSVGELATHPDSTPPTEPILEDRFEMSEQGHRLPD